MRYVVAAAVGLLVLLAGIGQCQEPQPSQVLNRIAGELKTLSASLEPLPAPINAEDWVAYPKQPVPVGKFAKFSVAPDLKDTTWKVIGRATLDPPLYEDSNGVDALVETEVPGRYVVLVLALRESKTVVLQVEFAVGGNTPPGPTPPQPTPTPPVVPSDKVTTVTYVYEKDDTAVPSSIHAVLNRLNRERDITATVFEQNTFDGDDQIPEQYKAALSAAQHEGLPAIVVLAGSKVLRVLKDPKTDTEVWEAVP